MSLWDTDFSPMLLKEVEEPFNDKNYLYEVKFDGIRAIVYASSDKVVVKSRNNLDITNLFPELKNISKNIKKNVIFDGEIIIFKDNKISFSSLQKRVHLKNKKTIEFLSETNPVLFVAFDCLYEKKDLVHLPLLKRKEYLAKYEDSSVFVKAQYVIGNGDKLFKEVKHLDLEGIIAKDINSTYEINERTDYWLKIKNYKSGYFWVLGYVEKEYILVLLLGEKRKTGFCFVGKVSISKKRKNADKIIKTAKKKGKNIYTKDKDVVLVAPVVKCLVKYLEKTENGALRQPFIP